MRTASITTRREFLAEAATSGLAFTTLAADVLASRQRIGSKTALYC